MTAADVESRRAVAAASGFTLDMAFNGGGRRGSARPTNGGSDPLDRRSCVADQGAVPLDQPHLQPPVPRLRAGLHGRPVAVRHRTRPATPLDEPRRRSPRRSATTSPGRAAQGPRRSTATELVTGEHSGLKILPQQPDDNPNLAGALADTGIKLARQRTTPASPQQRTVGPALTVPRYPMNIFFNVGHAPPSRSTSTTGSTPAGPTAAAASARTTRPPPACIAPLTPPPATPTYIVPLETRIALGHVARPTTRARTTSTSPTWPRTGSLYPVLDSSSPATGRSSPTNTPIVNLRMTAIGAELQARAPGTPRSPPGTSPRTASATRSPSPRPAAPRCRSPCPQAPQTRRHRRLRRARTPGCGRAGPRPPSAGSPSPCPATRSRPTRPARHPRCAGEARRPAARPGRGARPGAVRPGDTSRD